MAARKKKAKAKAKPVSEITIPESILDQLEGSGGTKPCVKRWLAAGFKSTQRRKLFRAVCKKYLEKRADGTVAAVGWAQFQKVLVEVFEKEGFNFGQQALRKYLQAQWPALYANAS